MSYEPIACWPNMVRGRLAKRPCAQSGEPVSATCQPYHARVSSLARPSLTEPCAGIYRLAFYSQEHLSWRALVVGALCKRLRHSKMTRARPTAMAETVRAIAAASSGGWRRVRVWQYTLRRYFHISGGGCAREKNHGAGHNGAAEKPERMSPAHWFAPWMGANRYDSTYPRIRLGVC